MLLRTGITCREFEELSRSAFVEVASRDYGIRGRPTNVSRIAAMTGLSRKEVRRIRQASLLDGKAEEAMLRSIPAEILHRWVTDQVFLGPEGAPLDLQVEGGDVSFAALVAACSTDLPPGALKKELLRVGAIEERADGSLRLLTRNYVPSDLVDKTTEGVNFGLAALASTISHNTDPQGVMDPRYQQVVDCSDFPASRTTELQQDLRVQLSQFAYELDDRISAAREPADLADPPRHVGVGLYFFVLETECDQGLEETDDRSDDSPLGRARSVRNLKSED